MAFLGRLLLAFVGFLHAAVQRLRNLDLGLDLGGPFGGF